VALPRELIALASEFLFASPPRTGCQYSTCQPRRCRRRPSGWVWRENEAARKFYESLNGSLVAEKIVEHDTNIVRFAFAYGWADLTVLTRTSKAIR
jgi:hypothetical protein